MIGLIKDNFDRGLPVTTLVSILQIVDSFTKKLPQDKFQDLESRLEIVE